MKTRSELKKQKSKNRIKNNRKLVADKRLRGVLEVEINNETEKEEDVLYSRDGEGCSDE